jgi:hypothetical protein
MSYEHNKFIKLIRHYTLLLFVLLNMPYLLAIAAAMRSYRGTCYNSTNSSFPCTFGAYAHQETNVVSFLAFAMALFCVAFWGMAIGRYLKFKLGNSGIFGFLPFAFAVIGIMFGYMIWMIHYSILSLIVFRR